MRGRTISAPRASIAVDWSGAAAGGGRTVWVAEVVSDQLVFLENRWSRDRLFDWALARAERDPSLVLGLDFAFSFPAWFVQEQLGGTVELAWERATANGEEWLREVPWPFWGRPGRRRPVIQGDRTGFRVTDVLPGRAGIPKSVFQVGGAGAVGTASVRGMPLLARLRSAGFAIWPFDRPSLPLVVEIYPRALTGAVVKSDAQQRVRYLDEWDWPPRDRWRSRVAETEDSFDAAVSARRMGLHADEFAALPAPTDLDRIEGRIWAPSVSLQSPGAQSSGAQAGPGQPLWQREWDPPLSLAAEWAANAPDWIKWAREPGHDSYWRFHRDRFLELLPPEPADVLDLGCGEGRLPRDLTARGRRPVGVDAARAMVAAARDLDPTGRYVVADAADLPFRDASFDAVLAFMSLHDVDDLPQAVAEAARVIRPGGWLCAAVVHPLNSSGRFESLDPEATFRLDGPYLTERKYVDEGGRDGIHMRFASYHRPLGSYFRELERQGLVVDRLREVTVDPRSVEARQDRNRWLGVPLFLHFRAFRIASPSR